MCNISLFTFSWSLLFLPLPFCICPDHNNCVSQLFLLANAFIAYSFRFSCSYVLQDNKIGSIEYTDHHQLSFFGSLQEVLHSCSLIVFIFILDVVQSSFMGILIFRPVTLCIFYFGPGCFHFLKLACKFTLFFFARCL